MSLDDSFSMKADAPSFVAGARSGPAARSGEVRYHWDLTSDKIEWGPNLRDVIGFAGDDAFATGLAYAGHLAPVSPSSRYEAIIAGGFDTGNGVPFQVIYGLLPHGRSAEAPIWVEDSGVWFADGNGRPARAAGAIRVVTAQYEEKQKMIAAAQRDSATGIFTQAHCEEQGARYLNLSVRKHNTFAIVLIDLSVRRQGRDVFDAGLARQALCAAASRMTKEMRASEILAHHGERGLALLLENCNGEQMEIATRRLFEAVGQAPIETTDGPVEVHLRAGGVIAPLYGRTLPDLVDRASEALAIARETDSPAFVRYEPEAARTAVKRRLLVATDAIIAALNEGRVVLALQPVVHAKSHAVAFYEALVRIRSLDGSLLMPDVLVPAAEQGGLVALLDRRVADLALARLNADKTLGLAVNASVMSLQDRDWQQHFQIACSLYPDAAKRLTIEITETCAIADIEATREVLMMLKSLGIKIAIDDFGSGHSSFRTLRSLPIDYLKIDGAFARNCGRSADDQFFIRTLIDLARNLQIPTVAEWVEDEATARSLTAWGIDYLQGHFFGRAEIAVEDGRCRAVV